MSKSSSLSSKRWLKRHIRDKYVRLSYEKDVRSRAYFKLDQIHNAIRLFKKGIKIVDLGASPGSWSEYASKKIGRLGHIIACDILPMIPIKNVSFFQGDIRDLNFFNCLLSYLNNIKIDLVMSDIAPNMSGFHCIDHYRSIRLNKLVLKISEKILSHNGKLLIKSFYGNQFNVLIKKIKNIFIKIKIFKPDASRINSREVYIVASERRI
ncbi:MAG: SAM-dependent methyltransferase [Buchnera aphidicola (Nurudea yanoniella)]